MDILGLMTVKLSNMPHPYHHTLANIYTNVPSANIAPSHHRVSFVREFTFKYWSQALGYTPVFILTLLDAGKGYYWHQDLFKACPP